MVISLNEIILINLQIAERIEESDLFVLSSSSLESTPEKKYKVVDDSKLATEESK